MEAGGGSDGVERAVLYELRVEAALPGVPDLRGGWKRGGDGGLGWCQQEAAGERVGGSARICAPRVQRPSCSFSWAKCAGRARCKCRLG